MINMLRAPSEKVSNIKARMGNIRDGNAETESKRNVRNQKYCKRNKECLPWVRQETQHSLEKTQ